jgi:proteasome assembly chaperone (PAC2) family protein
MNHRVEYLETPAAEEIYLIAGWRQWADAGALSSGLPQYLIEQTGARHVASIKSDDFYLFQIPGMHHFLRPEITLDDGYRANLSHPENHFFYAGDEKRGILIFLGDEPHLNAERYAEAFFDVVTTLNVRHVTVLGGVYGAMPYKRARHVSAVYSMRHMRETLERYAVSFSNYEGGTTIGTYLLDLAEALDVELVGFHAFVPAYDFDNDNESLPGVRIENDFKAWYEIMRRINTLYGLSFDLSELERRSRAVVAALDKRMAQLEEEIPALDVDGYLAQLDAGFTESPFEPLDEAIWNRELDDLFRGLDDSEG